jgi:hypothetical protein
MISFASVQNNCELGYGISRVVLPHAGDVAGSLGETHFFRNNNKGPRLGLCGPRGGTLVFGMERFKRMLLRKILAMG